MKKKLVQRVKKPLNDNIVAIATTASCTINQDFYVEQMGEIPDSNKNHLRYTNYPVKVVAVPIDWLMNQK
jgi:hypothetical protein